MAGTLAPFVYSQFLDNNGSPAAGHQLFTYAAGTTTKQATYSDVGLTVPNPNPIVLNSAGACTVYLTAGTNYKFLLATPSDTDPPTSPVWTRDNVAAVPISGSSPDVTGPIGDTGVLGNVYYLSDGTGGKTAGTWYKGDASATYSSTTATQIAMATGPVTSGTSGTLRLIGQVTGLSSLAAGTVYYIDTTPGGLTTSPPANARAVGTADSTTSIILSQGVGMAYATATVPGIVSTASQTFAGAKTFNGAIVAASSALSTSASAGIGYATGAGSSVVQGTSKSTGVTCNAMCGQITMHNASLGGSTSVSFTLTNSSIGANDMVVVAIKSGATADSYQVGVQAIASTSCSIQLRNITSATALGEAVVLSFMVFKGVTA